MAAKGYYKNPTDRSCFELCTSCFRCSTRYYNQVKGVGTPCSNCSGCHDPHGEIDPHPDHYCRCTEGIMQWVSKQGHLIVRKLPGNPFQGDITVHSESGEDRDWKAYLTEMREKLDDPTWDPIEIYDSSKDPNAKYRTQAARFDRKRK